ncbi:MFS transporter [Limobrevibacterium gyesilva]|uniref:MFS transporter n=1 Tax=Limobrevibacterium gyesilva TaxID=2991712 RepID=A0AA42CHH4_9PROT|nr:MFS transporter [Limobrevibacterium gyesilva]MCW3477256.1 MFS transporter [Limobrevibacterium gyesilva]
MSAAGQRRAIAAWVMYDWAYGAFTTVVSTFVFATYFTRAVAADPASGAAGWAGAQTAAALLITVLSVPLGAVADRGGRRRPMLAAATAIMATATLCLWFVRPVPQDVPLALALVVTATVAFEVATVFYNAMLPGLASPGHLGRLSMLGWGAGYAGGLSCLGLSLVLLISPEVPPFGLDRAQAEHVRATALLAGAWLIVFGWPVSVFVPETAQRAPWGQAVREGMAELREVLRALAGEANLRRFLIARLFYMDGLTTLFAFGGIYAAGTFGMDAQEVLIFGIGLNVTAGLGALGFAFLEDRIGAKTTIMTAVLALAALGTAVLLVHDRTLFWALGLGLGVFVGPAQAASRSLMARLAPADASAAWFGMFALSGRVTAFLGPMALGAVTAAFHSQRAGMAVIPLFLVAGAALLAGVASPGAEIRPPRPGGDIGQPDQLRHQ